MTAAFSLQPSELRDISVFADAVDLLEDKGLVAVPSTYELSGFGQLPGNQKYKLEGVPFLIIEFVIHDFAEALIVTTTDEKWRLRDSSKGICQQLRDILEERIEADHPHPHHGIYVKRGLRFEERDYRNEVTGVVSRPRTYYLDL